MLLTAVAFSCWNACAVSMCCSSLEPHTWSQLLQVQKYIKRMKPAPASNAAAVSALARELLQAPEKAPAGLTVSSDGLSVRVAFESDEAAARALNPGFLELELGTPVDALAAIVADKAPAACSVVCTLVPADSQCGADTCINDTFPALPSAAVCSVSCFTDVACRRQRFEACALSIVSHARWSIQIDVTHVATPVLLPGAHLEHQYADCHCARSASPPVGISRRN